MKNIKHLIIIAFGLFLISNQNIQSQVLNSSEIGNSSINIPQTLKSDKNITKKNISSFSIHSEYREEINGYINITLDENGFIAKITTPNSVKKGILIDHYRSAVPCPHCLPYSENKDCVIECIIETIFN